MLMRNCIQIPDIHEKSGGGGEAVPCACNPSTGELRQAKILGACWQPSWQKLWASASVRDPVSREQGRNQERGKPYILLWVDPRVQGLLQSLAHCIHHTQHMKGVTLNEQLSQVSSSLETSLPLVAYLLRCIEMLSWFQNPFVSARCKETGIILKSSLNWKNQHDGILTLRRPRWEEDKLKARLGCIARPCLDNIIIIPESNLVRPGSLSPTTYSCHYVYNSIRSIV